MIPYDLVIVEWSDSYGCSSSWQYIDADYIQKNATSHKCTSVGYLVVNNEQVITVIPHMSPKNEQNGGEEQGCGDMTIPKSAIIYMAVLQKKKSNRHARYPIINKL